jgi:hypothetical protein
MAPLEAIRANHAFALATEFVRGPDSIQSFNFTQGHQTLFMDPYVVFYPREKSNLCPNPDHGIGSGRARVGRKGPKILH